MAHSNVARCVFRNFRQAANLINSRVVCRINTSAVISSRFNEFQSALTLQPAQLQKHVGCRYFADDSRGNVDLTFHDLQALIKSGDIQLIDVREPKELVEYGRYPKAVNIPLPELQDALDLSPGEFRIKYGANKPQKEDANIVFCCQKGNWSLKALGIASEFGFLKTRNYKGGWEEYHKEMGLPLKQTPS